MLSTAELVSAFHDQPSRIQCHHVLLELVLNLLLHIMPAEVFLKRDACSL